MESIETLSQKIESDPNNGELYYLMGKTYHKMGNSAYKTGDAISVIEKLTQDIKNDPTNGKLYYLRGIAYYEMDTDITYDNALVDFDNAAAMGFDVCGMQGWAQYHISKQETKISGNNEEFQSKTYYEKGDKFYNDAINAFDKALTLIDNKNLKATIYSEKGRMLYYKKGDNDGAAKDCNKAISIDPNDYYARLVYNKITKSEQQIIEEFTQFYNSGKKYMQHGDVDSAIAEFAKILPCNYNKGEFLYPDEEIWFNAHKPEIEKVIREIEKYGKKFFKNKEYTDAIKCYTLSIEKDYSYNTFGNLWPPNSRGKAYYRRGDYDNALLDFHSAEENSYDILNSLLIPCCYISFICLQKEDYSNSMLMLEKVLKEDLNKYCDDIAYDAIKVLFDKIKQMRSELQVYNAEIGHNMQLKQIKETSDNHEIQKHINNIKKGKKLMQDSYHALMKDVKFYEKLEEFFKNISEVEQNIIKTYLYSGNGDVMSTHNNHDPQAYSTIDEIMKKFSGCLIGVDDAYVELNTLFDARNLCK
jgi:tetratricopeptide (TPR) repeat protein